MAMVLKSTESFIGPTEVFVERLLAISTLPNALLVLSAVATDVKLAVVTDVAVARR